MSWNLMSHAEWMCWLIGEAVLRHLDDGPKSEPELLAELAVLRKSPRDASTTTSYIGSSPALAVTSRAFSGKWTRTTARACCNSCRPAARPRVSRRLRV
jgi:hypothetical protein